MEISGTELEALLKQTTAEVLSRTKQQSQTVKSQNLSMPKLKQLLLIIPSNIINLNEWVKQIENKYSDYELCIASYKKTEAIKLRNAKEIYDLNGEPSRDNLASNVNKFDEIAILSPELKQMRAIVEWDDTGYIENIVIYSLLHKKKVVFLFDYEVQALPSNSFGKKVKDLLGSISQMGVIIEAPKLSKDKKSDAVTASCKQLITERDVQDFYKSGIKEILCEKGCIITPLAKDASREMGISFIQLEV